MLSVVIAVAKTLRPSSNAIFPVWQGMQYLRDMSSGRGQLEPLDNDRYGVKSWQTARDVVRITN
jgi:hypothetical protein